MRLIIRQHSPAYWQVTLDNPPLNLFDPEMLEELSALMDTLEADKEVKVVVFDSANSDYFIAHIDLIRSGEFDLTPRATGLSGWPDIARRLELAPFVNIGLIRGRARAVGSEFIQALDMRFASREKALFAQIELGCGLIPGGGGLERLPAMIGRGRAMEVVIGADDFDADTAALYGWVNRSLPDSELDDFVRRLAKRIALFDRQAIADAKRIIYKRTGLAPVEAFKESQAIFFEAIARPEISARIAKVLSLGFQQPGDYEMDLGRKIGEQ